MTATPSVRIQDVAVFLKGKKPSVMLDAPSDAALPYVLIESFGGTYKTFTNDPACVRCYRDDTIIVADGANTGLTSTSHDGYLGSTLGALRPDGSKVNHRYLFYFVQGNFNMLNTRTRGAAIPHLERELLLDLEFALPPLSEQERIVRILDEADALRRFRQQADERCGTLIASLYSRVFLQAKQRQLWRVESIGDLAEQRDGAIRTGPFGSQLLHSEFIETGIPVLGIENVVTNEFRWTAPRCIPDAKYRQFERFRVFPGDVLVTIMGTVGRSCVAPDELPLCMSTKHLCVITPDATKIHPRFLWAALLFDPGVRQQTGAVGGGAIMEGWNSTIIRHLEICIPPIALQYAFAAGVADIRQLEAEQARSRQRLDDLFQSLLHRASQGEL
jgi:type I restriction enzyme S subunit